MSQENKKIKSFTDLIVWQKGHVFVVALYQATENFPKKEIFGLVSQLRRAGISFTSNIAEGYSRESYKERVKFYFIALGSLYEIQNQLLIARDVGYLSSKDFDRLITQTIELTKITNGLIKKTKNMS
jgi:four helix bundle protein